MSTRYVWGRYSVANTLGYDPKSFAAGRPLASGLRSTGNYVATGNAQSCTLSGTQVTFPNTTHQVTDSRLEITSGDYFAYIGRSPANLTVPIDDVYYAGSSRRTDLFLLGSNNDFTMYANNSYSAQISVARGTLQGYNSSSNSGAYPQDGVSGDYWYEYQGSDNIDAASVGYSTLEPRGGETITINVTPSSGKVYSGTVSYLYQVQLDGGSWTTIATTTATSQNYTIPKGTQTFAARVRAQDDIGFTSSTYTTGATVTVKNSNAFVGVGGVVRNVEPRVCVNGVIYTNVTSYVCVDGVIRQS